MDLLKPVFVDGLLKVLAFDNAAKSNEAFKMEEYMLAEFQCAVINDIVKLVVFRCELQ